MQRLSKFDGGRGYYVDDAKSLQQQLDLYRKFLLTGRGNFVLGGCAVSTTASAAASISAGLAVLNGRCIEVPALTATQFPAYLVQDTDASEGVRAFDLEGASFAAFVRERVKLVYTNPGGNYIEFNSTGAKDAIDRIAELLGISAILTDIDNLQTSVSGLQTDVNNINNDITAIEGDMANKANKALTTAWADLPLLTGAVWAGAGGAAAYADTYAPAYCKDSFGFVHLRGTVDHSDFSFASLPIGFRPSNRGYFGNDPKQILIYANGNCSQTIATAGTAEIAYLDGISFYVG